MPKFTVHMTVTTSFTQEVEADDAESAIDVAYDEGVQTICAQCSGWGQEWSRDEGDSPEAIEVQDADGKTVWTDSQGLLAVDGGES